MRATDNNEGSRVETSETTRSQTKIFSDKGTQPSNWRGYEGGGRFDQDFRRRRTFQFSEVGHRRVRVSVCPKS